MENLAVVCTVLAVVSCAMTLIWWLSGRDTSRAAHGMLRPQEREHRRYGLFYADPDDPRVWVPRPLGNGWDPNLATTGGKAIAAVAALVTLGVVVGALLTR